MHAAHVGRDAAGALGPRQVRRRGRTAGRCAGSSRPGRPWRACTLPVSVASPGEDVDVELVGLERHVRRRLRRGSARRSRAWTRRERSAASDERQRARKPATSGHRECSSPRSCSEGGSRARRARARSRAAAAEGAGATDSAKSCSTSVATAARDRARSRASALGRARVDAAARTRARARGRELGGGEAGLRSERRRGRATGGGASAATRAVHAVAGEHRIVRGGRRGRGR